MNSARRIVEVDTGSQVSQGTCTVAEDCLVSVVIATWNRKSELRNTLRHYQGQSYQKIEIIVVDNGSTDGTADMIAKEFPTVRLIKLNENLGVKAYNIGMKESRGQIVVVSDNDSYLEPTGVQKIIHKFQQGSPKLAVAACEIVYLPHNAVYQWYPHPVDKRGPKADGYPSHLFIGAGAAIKKEILEKVGYYPEEFFLYMNEVDLCTRIIGAGYEVRYFPDIVAYHRWTDASRAKDRTRLLSFRNIIWYYWKYFPFHIALGRSLIRIPFELVQLGIQGVNILRLLATLAETLGKLPHILRNRHPIPKKYVRKALGYTSEISTLFYLVREKFSRRRNYARGVYPIEQ